MKRAASLVAIIATILPGCSAFFGVVTPARDHVVERKEQRQPTSELRTNATYTAVREANGELRLICEEQQRSVDKTWQVEESYLRPTGPIGRSGWAATIAGDLFAGGMLTGILAITCESKANPNFSCLNMLWGAPNVLSSLYGLYRLSKVQPKRLMNRTPTDPYLSLSEPIARKPVVCSNIAAIAFGTANRAPDEAPSWPVYVMEQSVATLPLSEYSLALGSSVLNPQLRLDYLQGKVSLFAIDREQRAHEVTIERRCDLFYPPLNGEFDPQIQAICAPPPQPPQR